MHCELDSRAYPKGIKVSDAEIAALNITGDAFHPEWNYTISPARHLEAVILGRGLSLGFRISGSKTQSLEDSIQQGDGYFDGFAGFPGHR